MNDPQKHMDALHFLLSRAKLSDDDIERMSSKELDEFLAANGVDLNALHAMIPVWQQKAAGRLEFVRARRARLGLRAAAMTDADPASLPANRDQLLSMLIAHFGSVEAIPMAARNLKTVDVGELQQLIVDLGLSPKSEPPQNESAQSD